LILLDDAVQRTRQNRKRRIDLSSDDDESDNNRDYEKNNQMEGYTRDMHSDVEEDDYEEEEDYPEDPFPRSKFIDDYAEEDDDFEEEPVKVKQPEDPMREIISKAKDKMIANLPSSSKSIQAVSDSSSSSDSSDSESDAPDYGGISAPLSQGPNHNVHLVILDEDSSSTPLSKPSTSNMANASSSKSKNTEKSQKRPSKKDKKRQKKHK
jgi:hypothetical protein